MLVLRMVISELGILLLPDSDVETAYFPEDNIGEGRPSSHTHHHHLSSSLGEKQFQGFGVPGAGELVFPALILRNIGQQRLRGGWKLCYKV